MSVINKVLGVFLGDKYARDMKELMPHVEKTKAAYEKVQAMCAENDPRLVFGRLYRRCQPRSDCLSCLGTLQNWLILDLHGPGG